MNDELGAKYLYDVMVVIDFIKQHGTVSLTATCKAMVNHVDARRLASIMNELVVIGDVEMSPAEQLRWTGEDFEREES